MSDQAFQILLPKHAGCRRAGEQLWPWQLTSSAFVSSSPLRLAPSAVQQGWTLPSYTPNSPVHPHLTQTRIHSPHSRKHGLTWYASFFLIWLLFLWLFVPIPSNPRTQDSLPDLHCQKAGSSLRMFFSGITLALVLSLSFPPGLYSNATWNHQAILSKGAKPHSRWLCSS